MSDPEKWAAGEGSPLSPLTVWVILASAFVAGVVLARVVS